MRDPRQVFEALMKANGYEDLSKSERGHYSVPTVQTRWKYFLLGWEMRGLK
jgi:hypothetical protein